MPKTKTHPVRFRSPLVPHESLDAYWFAQMLRHRALKVAADARCKSTIGRRLDSALGRVIRSLVEAADGSPEKADARLMRACAAIGLALSNFDDLALRRGVREVVIADLRERASLLLERLEMLEGEAVETWPASNCLPSVLDEVKQRHAGGVDVVAALSMLPAAAVRGLPEQVVAEEELAEQRPARSSGDAVSTPLHAHEDAREVMTAL